MAHIRAFRGYRYSAKAGDLNRVVTQPYDKIPVELQQDYYGRSPFNAARITRNQEKNSDPHTEYPDAAATMERWIADGTLVQDPEPSIYAYYREYVFEGERKLQKGFMALLDLRRSAGGILPHERTHTEARLDRLRLMRGSESNDDSIFTLYTDDARTVVRLLDAHVAERPPDISVADDYGAVHRVWAISDSKAVRAIQDAMVPEELFIADGHHRFETSVTFWKECEGRGWKPGAPESFDQRLVTCFNSADGNITILPTHRLVHSVAGFRPDEFLKSAAEHFAVESAESIEACLARLKELRGREHVYGFYPAGTRRPSVLILKEEAKSDELMLAHPEAYRHLDVSILHTLILKRFLGIDEAKLEAETNVDYERAPEACAAAVSEGRYQAAFFLNPTTVEQVQRVALLGERMPQKSTDFYPKLLTGLVFMKMKIVK